MLDRRRLQLVQRPVAPQTPKDDITRPEEPGAAGYALSSRHCLTRSLAIPLSSPHSPIAINNNHVISAVLHVDSPAEFHLLAHVCLKPGRSQGPHRSALLYNARPQGHLNGGVTYLEDIPSALGATNRCSKKSSSNIEWPEGGTCVVQPRPQECSPVNLKSVSPVPNCERMASNTSYPYVAATSPLPSAHQQ